MALISETGHFVNLENFKLIIERVTGFGVDYNPTNNDLTVAAMTTQWTTVNGLHSNYITSIEATRLPVNSREDLFDTLVDISRRSLNLYGSTKASPKSVKDARGIMNKITGKNRKIKLLEDGTPDPKWVSTSQKSFTKRADNFKHLIEIYKTDTNYASNETALTTASMEILLADIVVSNSTVAGLITDSTLNRIARNEGLYLEGSGIIDVSLACKKYVRSLYGAVSETTKTVTSIYLKRFLRVKR